MVCTLKSFCSVWLKHWAMFLLSVCGAMVPASTASVAGLFCCCRFPEMVTYTMYVQSHVSAKWGHDACPVALPW